MVYFYLVTCANRTFPTTLQDKVYVHVKGKVNGEELIAITEEPVSDVASVEKTQEQVQVILDQWIDDENAIPALDPVSGEPVVQTKINLSVFLES